jgi:O-antigen ligase
MSKSLKIAVFLMVLVLPTATNLFKHAGSVMLAILTLLGIYAWLTREKNPVLSRSEKFVMGAFAAYFVVCLLFFIGYGVFSEMHSLRWDLGHEIRMLAIIPIWFLFYRTRLKSWPFWYGIALAAIISGVYAIFYVYGLSAKPRAEGSYHAIAFGDISLALGFMSLAGIHYFQKQHRMGAIIPILAAALGILASFLSGTRGAIIAIPFLALIFFIQLGGFKSPWRARGILILSIVLLSVGFYHLPGSSLDYRIRTGLNETKAFFQGKGAGPYAVRLGIWQEGWKMFAGHPIYGLGKDGYEQTIREKKEKKEISELVGKYDSSPHNMYLNHLIAYGISGLVILMGIFLSPLLIYLPAVKKNNCSRDIGFSGIMLIAAFMIFALTESIFNRNVFISLYLILTAAMAFLTAPSRQGN